MALSSPPRRRPRTPTVAPRGAGWRRSRRVAVLTACIALVPVVISFAASMLQRSSSGVGIRAVEWLRDHGARGIVNDVENIYYSLNAPAKGGPGLRSLPRLPGVATSTSTSTSGSTHHAAPAYTPPAIAPVIQPALPGEGVWRSTFVPGGARPPVLITSFRPEPDYPRLVAGVAWIDHTRTTVMLYPGIQEPAVSLPDRGPEEVPLGTRYKLVATFNSAFKLADSGGGFALDGHTYAPMHDGQATIVRYRNGTMNVMAWQGGSQVGSDVLYARQDLPLILNGGQLNPNLSDGPEWGATLGNAIRVWRSGIGIDSRGNLIYAAANDQTVASLARILQRAGAVRAMELDINAYWPSFITYRLPGAVGAANLLPDMVRSSQRYLTPEDRDFFAVYLR